MSLSAIDSGVCGAGSVSTVPARVHLPIWPSRLVAALTMLSALTMVAAATSIASAQGQPAHSVAPNNETVTATTMLLQKFGGSAYKEIRVQNASTVPIVVSSVTLLNCVNIRQDCNEPAALSVHVAPATHETIYRVEPCDAEVDFSFRYTMQWRADTAGVAGATGTSPAMGRAIVSLRVEPDSLVMHVGGHAALHQQVRVFGVDAQGDVVGPVQTYSITLIANPILTINADTVTARTVGRSAVDFQVASSKQPLTVTLPIIVIGDVPQ